MMNSKGMIRTSSCFMFILSALYLTACGSKGGGSPAPATLPGADAAQLFNYIKNQNPYTSWAAWPLTTKLYPGRDPHGAFLNNYVSDIAAASIAAATDPVAQHGMANGSIIVKENYGLDKTFAALTVMYRVHNYNPPAGDWFWAEYLPDGTVVVSGKVADCIACHSNVNANDDLFTGDVIDGVLVEPGAPPPVSFKWRIQSLLSAMCTECHRSSGTAGFLQLTSDASYTALVNQPAPKTTGTLVVPGDSVNSVLYQRVSGIGLPAGTARMPFGKGPLSSGNQNIIKIWIDQGANNN
jgi:cytochrome P460